jgi:hypothetical protein
MKTKNRFFSDFFCAIKNCSILETLTSFVKTHSPILKLWSLNAAYIQENFV